MPDVALFRRKRRPDDRLFLDRDAKLWRRLIKMARYQVRAPLVDAYPLLKAADACGKAALPPGHVRRDSCFVRLMALGRIFWRLDHFNRTQQAADLERLAAECEAALADPAPSPGRPPRRDIFG